MKKILFCTLLAGFHLSAEHSVVIMNVSGRTITVEVADTGGFCVEKEIKNHDREKFILQQHPRKIMIDDLRHVQLYDIALEQRNNLYIYTYKGSLVPSTLPYHSN